MASISNVTTRTRHRRTRRRGSLYVAVLGVTIIVGMMGLAAMHVVRMNLKASTSRNDRYEAVVLASSAVENGLIVVDNTPTWRTSLVSGVTYPATPVTLGRGTFTWKLIDTDGNLADDPSDSVLLQGIGRVGDVTHVEQVLLQPTNVGLTCLQASLHCQSHVMLATAVNFTTSQMVSSNGNILATAIGSSINGNAQAVGNINGNITGTKTSGIAPRQMPGSDAFDYYVNMGSLIDINLLAVGPTYQLKRVVLSPQSNPYGSPNPEGIYVIDCKGLTLQVQDLRVFGTLVLLNPAPSSTIQNKVHFEPARPNFPSLLVKGSIEVRYDSGSQLSESSLGVNFNPIGTPYQGSADTDTSDNYPSIIKGLVFVSGQLNLALDVFDSAVDGVVVCGSIVPNSNLALTYRSTFFDFPPPGFAAGSTMKVAPGSWVRAVSP